MSSLASLYLWFILALPSIANLFFPNHERPIYVIKTVLIKCKNSLCPLCQRVLLIVVLFFTLFILVFPSLVNKFFKIIKLFKKYLKIYFINGYILSNILINVYLFKKIVIEHKDEFLFENNSNWLWYQGTALS